MRILRLCVSVCVWSLFPLCSFLCHLLGCLNISLTLTTVDIELPFTEYVVRSVNISRIRTNQSRWHDFYIHLFVSFGGLMRRTIRESVVLNRTKPWGGSYPHPRPHSKVLTCI